MVVNEQEKLYLNFIKEKHPIEFLTLKKGKSLSDFELAEVNKIISEVNLPSGVLNMVIDFALQKNADRFVKNYILVIAKSLEEKEFTNLEEAFVYFKNHQKERRKNPQRYYKHR